MTLCSQFGKWTDAHYKTTMRRAIEYESKLRHIRAITLDLDDTLWDVAPVIERAEARLWRWLGEHYPRITETFDESALLDVRREVMGEYRHKHHDFRFLRKKSLARIAVRSGYSDALVEDAFAVFDRARNEVELFPDVLPQLERLAARFPLIAVTNGNANLETIGIGQYFRAVVAAAEVGTAKPGARIFDVARERSGVPASDILHVGDHPETDVSGARNAGFRTAWMNRKGESWPDHLDAPDVEIRTIVELCELLDTSPVSENR